MYKVTGFELVYWREGSMSAETAHKETKYLTAAELNEYAKTHQRFSVETIKYEQTKDKN